MDEPLASAFVDGARWRHVSEHFATSRRETEVLECLFSGDSEKEISARLSISQATVHTHIKRLHKKLHVQNRAQLLAKIFTALAGGTPQNT